MQPNHLRNLQASGAWPEGLLHTGLAFVYTRRQDVEHLPDEHAEALFIVAMLDRLPDGFRVGRGFMDYPDWFDYRVEDGQKNPVSRDGNWFDSLYTALVAAGIVKEQA